MGILTFTSDYGLSDHYVAAVKGAVYSQLPEARIVDVSHQVSPFDTKEAAYHIRQVFRYFPKGSVHLIGVNADHSDEAPHRLVAFEGHYFVGADNGVFSLILDREPDAVYDINLPYDNDILTFPVLHLLVKAACHLLRGGTPEVIGKKTAAINRSEPVRPITDADSIRGHIIHVDAFGNLITDITQSLFREIGRGRSYTIRLRLEKHHIKKLSTHYHDAEEGKTVALFNTGGLLEIAINGGAPGAGGGVASLLGLTKGDLVLVVFND